MDIYDWRLKRECDFVWRGGDFSPLRALCFSLTPHSPFLRPFTFSLLQEMGGQCGNSSDSFFSISELPMWERGQNYAIGLYRSFCGKQTQARTNAPPQTLFPEPWLRYTYKPNTTVYSVDAGPRHTVVFPSHRGYQVTGTSWQSLLVICALVTTCWPKRDQYSLNKSCLLIIHGSPGVVNTHPEEKSPGFRKASKQFVWEVNLSLLPSR